MNSRFDLCTVFTTPPLPAKLFLLLDGVNKTWNLPLRSNAQRNQVFESLLQRDAEAMRAP